MTDHLLELAQKAKKRVASGYYEKEHQIDRPHHSLAEAVLECEKTPIITEIKYASPSSGTIRHPEPALKIAKAMLNGGATALSILTDPDDFSGGIMILAEVAEQVDVPVVMKDIVVSRSQMEAGARAGADAVVLIAEVFSTGFAEARLEQMIADAGSLGLEVLAEANGTREFAELRKHKPDLYGINNRNLSTFQLELSTTERILRNMVGMDRPVVSESGISSPADVRRLRASGANALLVGTSIMRAPDIESKVKELVNA